MTARDILQWPAAPYDHRLPYGKDPLQFGELRLPPGDGLFPVVVVIHGGCWQAEYNLDHIGRLCAALTAEGVATWSLEYRRIGDEGGGWPGTFLDVGRGIDHLRELEYHYPLDLKRVVIIGHSAGGHLALWAAARYKIPRQSPLYLAKPLALRGVVSLAGITDLRTYTGGCGDAVRQLMGGTPADVGERYHQASPREQLPLPDIAVRLVHGRRDIIVPLAQSESYRVLSRTNRGNVQLSVIDPAGHFELIDPDSGAWQMVRRAVFSLLQ
ncbi:MAG: alpha/beta hydrolase [Acidobacteria bacterium]|nr:alpha/beta hydrolase [Acidobacteriota bacterium]